MANSAEQICTFPTILFSIILTIIFVNSVNKEYFLGLSRCACVVLSLNQTMSFR